MFSGLDLNVFLWREAIHDVSQERIPGSVAGGIPAEHRDLCKVWDGILSQKRKRLLKGTGKHKADQVGWNGVMCLDDSHSGSHWAAWSIFSRSEHFI